MDNTTPPSAPDAEEKPASNGTFMDVQPPKTTPSVPTEADSDNQEVHSEPATPTEPAQSAAPADDHSTQFRPENVAAEQNGPADPAVTEPAAQAASEAPHSVPVQTSATSSASTESAPELAAAPPQDLSDTDGEPKPGHSPLAIANDKPAPPAKAKSGLPKAVVIIAVIVCLILGGVSVLAYLKSKDDKTTQSKTKTTAAAKTTTSKASTSDVDTASKDVNSSLSSLDDSKDLPTQSLSDSSLGL